MERAHKELVKLIRGAEERGNKLNAEQMQSALLNLAILMTAPRIQRTECLKDRVRPTAEKLYRYLSRLEAVCPEVRAERVADKVLLKLISDPSPSLLSQAAEPVLREEALSASRDILPRLKVPAAEVAEQAAPAPAKLSVPLPRLFGTKALPPSTGEAQPPVSQQDNRFPAIGGGEEGELGKSPRFLLR